MKIKYRENILKPNTSKYCIDCDMYEDLESDKTCFAWCYKLHSVVGFTRMKNCEVLEL